MMHPQIVWLRCDLRLADQAAFRAAADAGPVIPVYVLDDEAAGDRRIGAAGRWWLHGSLEALSRALARRGSRLVLRRGRSAEILAGLVRATGAAAVHALRHHEPWEREAEADVAKRCRLVLHDGNELLAPGSVTSGAGRPYRIFTPYYRAALQRLPPPPPPPLPEPTLVAPSAWPESNRLESWALRPSEPDWAGGLREVWQPGEAAGRGRLADFVERADDYDVERDMPSRGATSRLSPHLHWGEISPATVWHALGDDSGAASFRRQLLWRDFARDLLAEFPRFPEASMRAEFARLRWRDPRRDPAAARDLRAWQRGRTGYPIVDAGMRQLWESGWMHNRVRMIAASFLVKHLLIDWRIGERWFWDTLVDADYASNGLNWQWVAGTGVDSSPFGRIMAPLLQSAKFDAAGYIRHWVPELAGRSDAAIHDPDPPPPGYPPKIVGHREGRARALAASAALRAG